MEKNRIITITISHIQFMMIIVAGTDIKVQHGNQWGSSNEQYRGLFASCSVRAFLS